MIVGHSVGYVKASHVWKAVYSVVDAFYASTRYNFQEACRLNFEGPGEEKGSLSKHALIFLSFFEW